MEIDEGELTALREVAFTAEILVKKWRDGFPIRRAVEAVEQAIEAANKSK